MPDIVPNLLHLSSEVAEAADLLEPALELVLSATGSDAAAIARAALPQWSIESVRGVARSAVPLDLAAESLERGDVVESGGWLASPLAGAPREPGTMAEPEYVLMVRGNCPESRFAAVTSRLSDALAIVEQKGRAISRVDRLQAILSIINQWHQTNDMETLLLRMAEAATRLLDADRASIFLWDKPNKTIVGRPALGIQKGELRLSDDAGIVGQVIQTGEPRRVSSEHNEQEIDRAVDRQTGYRTKTILCVPLLSPDGSRLGAFEVLNKRDGAFSNEDQRGLVELASYAAVALENTKQFAELVARQEKMVEQAAQDAMLIGGSPAIQALRATAHRIADTDLAVLLLGENGTGKEVLARLIHFGSRRRKHPFIAVNCAAITETLLESELFGHEKGAFTDAHESRAGKFELASGGTLLLDEVGDMSLAGQAKLLARFGGEDDRSRGRQQTDSHRRASISRDKSETGRAGAREAVPRGPLLSAECRNAGAATVARTGRRCDALGRTLSL